MSSAYEESHPRFVRGMTFERRAEESLKVDIEQRDIGCIIGRGGSNIRQLEQQSGARIKINKQDCFVEISGSQEQTSSAKQLIQELLQNQNSRNNNFKNERSNRRPQYNHYNTAQEQGWDRDQQPQQQSWDRDQQPQQQSWDRDQQPQQQSWDREQQPQQQSWDRDQQPQLQSWDSDRQSQQSRGGGRQSYQESWDSDRHTQQQSWDSGRHSQQQSWEIGRQSQQRFDSGPQSQHQDWDSGPQSQNHGWDSVPQSQHQDWDSGRQSQQTVQSSGDSNLFAAWDLDSIDKRGADSGRSDRNTARPRASNDRNGAGGDTTVMEVGSNDVGKIIGKGGSKIRELQEESGANIQVSRDSGGYSVPVTIRGSSEAQEKAKSLIDALLQSDSRYKGGYGRFGADDAADSSSPPRQSIDWAALAERSHELSLARWKDKPELVKNFYTEHPDAANRSPPEVADIRLRNNNIVVNDLNEGDAREVPNPVVTFEEAFEHHGAIMDCIRTAGFREPSPIQKQAWPIALMGYDWIGIAQTGTGKTLAFLLPAFIHIEGQVTPRAERTGPTVLVLSPTRELALQIEEETKKYKYKGIKCVCVYGGGSRRKQIDVVTKGVEIVVATPGRLNDLIRSEFIDVTSVSYLVLDEADRMLDMGFEPEIRKIMLDIRPDRQTVMTSATWPDDVRRLASSYMRNPMQIYVGSLDLAAVHSVTQRIVIIDDDDKIDWLRDFIAEMTPSDKVIVFVGKKITADHVSSELVLQDILCDSIHGGREQHDREQAINDFRSGYIRILIATDVASRGLDIPDITHVVNYDFPRHMEEYVHRVGRTGRAGRTGTSITLMTRGDWRSAQALIDIMVEASQEVPDDLVQMARRYDMRQRRDAASGRGGRGRGRRGGWR